AAGTLTEPTFRQGPRVGRAASRHGSPVGVSRVFAVNRPVAALMLPLVSSLLLLLGSVAHAGPTDANGEPQRSQQAAERPDPERVTSRGAARIDPDASIHVKIDRVRPGILPTRGNVRLGGTVTNISDQT